MNGSSSKKALAVIAAACAMLAASVREAAPGRQPESFPAPPRLEDIALLEEIQAWLEPTGSDTASIRAGVPLHESIRARRASFELFIGVADGSAVRDRMQRVPFGSQILSVAGRHGIDPLLVAAVVQTESAFDDLAVSPRGACGLMQLMPATAQYFGVSNVYDPSENLEAGTRYLVSLLRRFDGDLGLSLAAYNAGPGAVGRFGGLPPFRETRNFTEGVLRIYIEHHRAAWVAVHPRRLDSDVLGRIRRRACALHPSSGTAVVTAPPAADPQRFRRSGDGPCAGMKKRRKSTAS